MDFYILSWLTKLKQNKIYFNLITAIFLRWYDPDPEYSGRGISCLFCPKDSNGGAKDKITARLFNQSFLTPVSCLGSE
jgi:hypothetical protein